MPPLAGARVGHRIIPTIDAPSFARVVNAEVDIGTEVLIDNDHLVFFAGQPHRFYPQFQVPQEHSSLVRRVERAARVGRRRRPPRRVPGRPRGATSPRCYSDAATRKHQRLALVLRFVATATGGAGQ